MVTAATTLLSEELRSVREIVAVKDNGTVSFLL